MARRTPRPRPSQTRTLAPVTVICPHCKRPTRADYTNFRTVSRLDGVLRLALRVRRCHTTDCPLRLRPYRPEAEGRLALPHHEFGLDVLALVGRLRHADHRSTTEIHQELVRRGLVLAQRTVTNVLDRYDELRALDATDPARFGDQLAGQSTVVLALDGLQPDVGHEVLWVLRDCVGGHILLARSLLSATQNDLAALLSEVRDALPIPISAVVSDGQHSIRKAVKKALPNATHQLCHFHYLREAAKPIYEADRHAKKELKKRVRGVRPLERAVADADDVEAEIVRGYCAAVRAALTDDGLPPLAASGLKLHDRLDKIAASLDWVSTHVGDLPRGLGKLRQLLRRGLDETAALWPPVRAAYRWVQRVARVLKNRSQRPARAVRRALSQLLSQMRRAATPTPASAVAAWLRHFVKVTASYRPGLCHCYAVADLPRTNNDLEHLFGSHRYHERRSSGRKRAAPGAVVSGAVRVVSGLATRLRPAEGLRLPKGYVVRWQEIRRELAKPRQARRQQWRFRRDPDTYLRQLEQLLIQLSLLS
jgi:hypothetical protein